MTIAHIRRTQPHRQRLGSAWIAAAVLVIGVGTVLGLPSCLAILVACVPWLIYLSTRVGWVFSIACVAIGGMSVLFGVLLLTAALQLAMLATIEIVATLIGIAGAALVWRSGRGVGQLNRASLLSGLPALLGGVVWLGVELAAQIVPGAAKLSWTMLGDSANNVLLMRGILRDQGIVFGAGENPVPLPNAFFAFIAASDRGTVLPADLLAHDIASLAVTWSILIAAICAAVGVTIGHLVRAVAARPIVTGLASGAGSLLPLSWFVTGYAIEHGFLDSVLAVSLTLAAFLVYSARARHDVIAVLLLCLCAVLLLAVWSPLVLIPGLLAAVVLVRGWRAVLSSTSPTKLLLALGPAVLLLYALTVTLPILLRTGSSLATAGAIFVFHNWMGAVIALVALVASILSARRTRRRALFGLLVVIVAALVGLAVLLYVSRNKPSPWTYYPLKFWWLCAIVFLVLALGLVAAAIAVRLRSIGLQLGALAVVSALTVAFLAWTPSAQPGYRALNPVARVVAARALGTDDSAANRVMHYVNPTHAVVLWHSNEPAESTINFWAWEMWAGSLKTDFDLRVAAYGHYHHSRVSDLCRIVGLLGGTATVYTEDPELRHSIRATCPERHATVIVQGAS